MEKANRIWQLDYLKAFCIINVIITHTWLAGYSKPSLIFPLFVNMAVPIFMIINGYNMAMSIAKRKNSLLEWYKLHIVLKKIAKIIIPYSLIFILEILYMFFVQKADCMNAKSVLYAYLTGGYGPGGYFVPVILQAVFVTPIIICLVKKNVFVGSAIIVLGQVIFEVFFSCGFISPELYRVLYFRYLCFTLAGIILYDYPKLFMKKKMIFGFSIISIIYLLTYKHIPILLFGNWKSTAMPVVFWAVGLVTIFMNLKKSFPSFFHYGICKIGESTFYIFLTQILYFIVIGNDAILSNNMGGAVVNVLCCIFLGGVFLYCCKWIEKKWSKYI